MRQLSPEALKSSPSQSSIDFSVQGKGRFELDASGYQQFIPAEPKLNSESPEVDSQPNWFGSEESKGMFTAKLFDGMRPYSRPSHGLETRPIHQVVIERTVSEEVRTHLDALFAKQLEPTVFPLVAEKRAVVMQDRKAS